ncbi:hypothetical protein GmHk_19G054760 [Glycine max]|nr:hypothetical protein GmHk_19G054760 [Glycine max]
MANPKVLVFFASVTGDGGSGKDPLDGGDSVSPPSPAKVSFRNKTMVNKEKPVSRPHIDLLKENLTKIEYEDDNPLKPKVVIADLLFEGLCTPWQDTLVVKLLRKKLGFNLMKERLSRICKLKVCFDLMDVGNDFYMAKFNLEEDRTKSPSFVSPEATIDKTMVWIRFPGLNLFFYDESILMALAAVVENPVRVDSNTLDVRRGCFARVCVEVDFNKPVAEKVVGSSKGISGEAPRIPVQPPSQGGTSSGQTSAATPQGVPPTSSSITNSINAHSMANHDKTIVTANQQLSKENVTQPGEPVNGEWLVSANQEAYLSNHGHVIANLDANNEKKILPEVISKSKHPRKDIDTPIVQMLKNASLAKQKVWKKCHVGMAVAIVGPSTSKSPNVNNVDHEGTLAMDIQQPSLGNVEELNTQKEFIDNAILREISIIKE